MENIRSRMENNGYLGLTKLGRPSKPDKGIVSEDLGQSAFKAGTSRHVPKGSWKSTAPKDDMDYDTSDDDIDAFSSKNKFSPPARAVGKIDVNAPKSIHNSRLLSPKHSRKNVSARPVFKTKPANTDNENASTPSSSYRSRPRPISDLGHADTLNDAMPPSNQLALKPNRLRKPSFHKESHGSPPLEELSPNRVERIKPSKAKATKLAPAPFPMQVKPKKHSPKRVSPQPAPFPMSVPSPKPAPRKPRRAPFSVPPSPRSSARPSVSSHPGPQPFPLDSTSVSLIKDDVETDEDEDELNIKPNDAVLTYGGPRPFPMSLSQYPVKPPQDASGPKRSAYIDSASDEDEHRVNKKSRPSPEPDGLGSLSLDSDDNVDPSTICPYCDEPWPSTPSPTLTALLERTKRKSYSDPRPGNALGLKAPLTAFIELCQRHRFEMTHLPLAIARGWPTRLDFASLPKRIGAVRGELSELIGRPEDSKFWREVRDDAKEVGMMKIVSVSGQYATFERSQPGYYGEQGSIIIHQSLYSLFPPDSIPPDVVLPLTPDQFLTRVLVPETAVLLIQQDMGLPAKEQAMRVLDESKKYGLAMFPEQAQDEEVAEVGEKLARERARARMQVLKERGEADADVKREIEKERRQARKAKGKGKESSMIKRNGRVIESDMDGELSEESAQTHKRKGKRKAKDPSDTPVAKASRLRATRRKQDEKEDVEMLDEATELTPRPGNLARTLRESSTTSWRANPSVSSSPDRPKAYSRLSSVQPGLASSQQSEVAGNSHWTFTMRDNVDDDEEDQCSREVEQSTGSDSDVKIIEDNTPKPKPKPRRIVKKVKTSVIHSEESASDAEPTTRVVVKKPRPKPKLELNKRDEVDGEWTGGTIKEALGQTKRRKKGKSTVKGARSESGESHGWLLNDSSDD